MAIALFESLTLQHYFCNKSVKRYRNKNKHKQHEKKVEKSVESAGGSNKANIGDKQIDVPKKGKQFRVSKVTDLGVVRKRSSASFWATTRCFSRTLQKSQPDTSEQTFGPFPQLRLQRLLFCVSRSRLLLHSLDNLFSWPLCVLFQIYLKLSTS